MFLGARNVVSGEVYTASTTLSAVNVAPTAALAGPAAAAGTDLLFTLTAVDPSSVDQAAPFTF